MLLLAGAQAVQHMPTFETEQGFQLTHSVLCVPTPNRWHRPGRFVLVLEIVGFGAIEVPKEGWVRHGNLLEVLAQATLSFLRRQQAPNSDLVLGAALQYVLPSSNTPDCVARGLADEDADVSDPGALPELVLQQLK
jgi:hypothetical protein